MCHGGFDGIVVRHIQLHHMGVAALAFDAGAQLLELFDAAAGQHHACARTGQVRKLSAQAAGSAGHEGHAARQVDAVCHLNFLQIPKNRTIVRLCAFACIQSVPSQTVDAPLPVENQTIIKRPTRRS